VAAGCLYLGVILYGMVSMSFTLGVGWSFFLGRYILAVGVAVWYWVQLMEYSMEML